MGSHFRLTDVSTRRRLQNIQNQDLIKIPTKFRKKNLHKNRKYGRKENTDFLTRRVAVMKKLLVLMLGLFCVVCGCSKYDDMGKDDNKTMQKDTRQMKKEKK